jgi:membrane protein implicated in regulation of membrane protease activity
MDPWVVWLIAAVVFGVGEIATLGFFLAPFAGGALLAAIVSGAGAGALISWAVFLVVSVTLLAALRPLARSHRRQPPLLRTGTAALVGSSAMVVERIANDQGLGSVRIGGEVWTARSYDDDEVIEAGKKVQVVEIRGATAFVTE